MEPKNKFDWNYGKVLGMRVLTVFDEFAVVKTHCVYLQQ